MGLLYNLQQQFDDGEREFLEKSEPYVEFVNLLNSIANFTDDTPHLVAKFLYDDGDILNLTAYDLDFEPKGQEYSKTYYQYNQEKDDCIEIDVGYSEWFFRTFLDYKTEKEYNKNLDYDDWCYFKKTDIINLDCLRKIGFVDLKLLDTIDEVEQLQRVILEKDKIIENLTALSSQPKTDSKVGTPSVTIVQPSIETLNQRIKDRDNQITALNERIAELEKQLAEKLKDDTELHPRTANNASKIILAMAELLKWDLSKPHAKETNGELQEVLERHRNKLSKDTIAYWLKQAYEIGK